MKLASKFKTATVLGAMCAAFAVPAHAEFTGSAGLGVHVWDGGYRDTDAQVWPIPAVDVETDHFYFKGLEAGGFLVKTDAHRLNAGCCPAAGKRPLRPCGKRSGLKCVRNGCSSGHSVRRRI